MKWLYSQDNAHIAYHEELERLIGNYEGKYILALQIWLSQPFLAYEDCQVMLHKKGTPIEKHENINVTIGRPFDNEGIAVAVKRFGTKKSKGFIPLIFDSFDDLAAIEKISIIWKISNKYDKSEYVVQEYDITFKEPIQKGIYCLSTYDKTKTEVYKEVVDNNGQLPCKEIEGKKRLIVNSASYYDDIYIFERLPQSLWILWEQHSEDSKYSIPLFNNKEKETCSCTERAVFSALPIVLQIATATINAEEESLAITAIPIIFYHTTVTLDDERIL